MEEEIPELHYCLPEEAETEKGVFSWVAASTNSTVKVLCPHGVVEGAPINKVWIVCSNARKVLLMNGRCYVVFCILTLLASYGVIVIRKVI